jgi:hypothetical protein
VRGGQNRKPQTARGRRDTASLPAGPRVQAPTLPKRDDGAAWHPLVLEWWSDLWASPIAADYATAHKHAAYLAAYTLDLFYRKPTERLGQRVAVALEGLRMGPVDLRKMRVAPEPTTEPAPTPKPKRAATPARKRDPRLRLINKAG